MNRVDKSNNEVILPVGTSSVLDRDATVDSKTNFEKIATLAEVEEKHIKNVLNLLNNNKTKAAKALGVSLKTLYNKLEKYDKEDVKWER